jgi:TPP-dependent pyruvate/acetoin dehydrogenase alpha subunit
MPTTTRKKSRRKTTSKKNAAGTTPASSRKLIPAPPPSSNEQLRALYASLLRCVAAQEAMADRTALNGAGTRQALAVATVATLAEEDTLTASAGDFAAMLARGIPASEVAHSSSAKGGAAHRATPADPFTAGAGIALAHKLEGKGNVVLAICPQTKPALEQWHDALQAAAAQKLPIVFVIENGVAIESPGAGDAPHLQPYSFFARGHEFPAIIVDGGDVVAVWRVAQEAVHRARNGAGPTLIDCRTNAEHDALAHLEHYLKTRHAWDEGWKRQLDSEHRGRML